MPLLLPRITHILTPCVAYLEINQGREYKSRLTGVPLGALEVGNMTGPIDKWREGGLQHMGKVSFFSGTSRLGWLQFVGRPAWVRDEGRE